MSAREGQEGVWTPSSRTKVLLILSVCACWVLLFANLVGAARSPGDDNFYLQSIAVSAKAPAALEALNQELVSSLEALGYPDAYLYRVVLRAKYANNYWAASKLQYLIATLVPVDPAMGMQAYHELMATRAILSTVAPGLILLPIFALGLFLIRDGRLFVAAIIGISVAAALYHSSFQANMLTVSPYIQGRVADNMSWIAAFAQSAFFFINPGSEFSMFGTSPRSNFVVIAFIAVLMRWDNRLALSYLMLAVAILFHASSGLIVLSLFLASSLAFRPLEMVKPMPMLAVGLCIALAIAQESMATILGFSLGAMIALAALCVLLAYGAYRLIKAIDLRQVALFRFFDSMFPDRVTADFVIFLFAWNASMALVLGRIAYLDYGSVTYLWSQLHTRTAAILQPMLITAIALFVLRATPLISNRLVVALSLALLFIAVAGNHVTIGDPRSEYVRSLSRLEARRLAVFPYKQTPPIDDEALWYYSMLRSLDFKTPGLGLVAH